MTHDANKTSQAAAIAQNRPAAGRGGKPSASVLLWVLLVLAAGGFCLAMAALAMNRFGAGDIYPPYSSLRSDPMGVKALYESLADLPQLRVRRNYQPLRKLADGHDKTLFYLGAIGDDRRPWAATRPATGPSSHPATRPASRPISRPLAGPRTQPTPSTSSRPSVWPVTRKDSNDDWDLHEEPSDGTSASLTDFIASGGRLIIALSPESDTDLDTLEELGRTLEFSLRDLGRYPAAQSKGRTAQPSPTDSPSDEKLTWHTFLSLKVAPPWRTIYSCGGRPVIAERTFKAGSVVVCCDSFFLSNEALLRERHAQLLGWLIGGREVIFDETHLGVREEAGISTLGRRYNLQWLLAVLLLLGGLFVWKNSSSFLPRDSNLARQLSGRSVAGEGTADGLLSLLRGSISPRTLLSTCLTQWLRSAPAGPRAAASAERVRRQVEGLVAQEEQKPRRLQDVAGAYRSICLALSKRGKPASDSRGHIS